MHTAQNSWRNGMCINVLVFTSGTIYRGCVFVYLTQRADDGGNNYRRSRTVMEKTSKYFPRSYHSNFSDKPAKPAQQYNLQLGGIFSTISIFRRRCYFGNYFPNLFNNTGGKKVRHIRGWLTICIVDRFLVLAKQP